MAIASVTYQQVVNTVVSWIQTNCANISNYAGIQSYFKTGYTSGKVTYAGSGTASLSCHTTTLKSNGVSSVSAATVTSDMTSFLSTCGLTDLSKTIPTSEFLDFIKDMVVFCSTKVVMVASQYSSTKYICYDITNTTYNDKMQLDTNSSMKIMEATDITQLLSNIITLVRQSMRNKTCQYTVTMSA